MLWISRLFPRPRLADEDDVLLAADEVALGQGFDLQARDGGIEVPVEGAQGQRFAEVGVLDEAFDAALAAQAGLIGEQAMQELQVRPAGVLGLLQGRVELLGGHGDAQGGEVGEDLVTQARGRSVVGFVWRLFFGRRFHRRLPRVRVNADSRWSGVDRSVLRAGCGSSASLCSSASSSRSGLGLALAARMRRMAAREKAPKRTARSRALEHIVALVMRHQRQELLRLQLALDLLGEQAVEELHGDRAEFAEALPQQQVTLAGIVGGMMALDASAARRSACWARADAGRSPPGRSSR